jgi:hypothetical protein
LALVQRQRINPEIHAEGTLEEPTNARTDISVGNGGTESENENGEAELQKDAASKIT